MSTPKTIITYLFDGNPQGIKTVEFSNKLIKGISIPKKEFQIALKDVAELTLSGVYFLLGEDEKGDKLAYLGQATVLGKRLNDHYKDTEKDFRNTLIAFTYKDGTLNESDINFLEKELIAEAHKANRYKIKNGNSGNNGLIQNYRKPDMLEFIEDLKILIINLGFNVLKPLVNKKELNENSKIYHLSSRGSDAKGIYTEEGFIVLKGSIGREDIIGYQKKLGLFEERRNKLIKNKIIKYDDGKLFFLEDHVFKTPTAACNIVSGGNLNGWLERKDKDGKTLNENERNS